MPGGLATPGAPDTGVTDRRGKPGGANFNKSGVCVGSDWQVVINFHGIGSAHDAVVESERPYWISADQFEAIIDRAQAHPNAKRVRWTFDDGNRSDLVIGARVLAERGMRGAFFVLTGRFDDPLYLSRADTRALADMGMAVGLHGKDHVDWRRLDPATLTDET